MPSIKELQEAIDIDTKQIADYQAQIVALQEASKADNQLQEVGQKLHDSQCPFCQEKQPCPFLDEKDDWKAPEHAFWMRFAQLSIINGSFKLD